MLLCMSIKKIHRSISGIFLKTRMSYSLAYKQDSAHAEAIWSCCWPRLESQQNDVIVTGSLDNAVKIWQWDDVQLAQINTLEPHQLGVISLNSSSDGSKLVTSSIECCIKVYQLTDGSKLGEINAGPVDAWTAGLSPDGSKIATGSQGGRINVYQTETLTKDVTLKAGEKFIMSVAYSPDGGLLAGASHEGIIYIFDSETSTLLHTVEAHAMPIRRIKFSSDGRSIFSAADDKYAKIHNVASAVSLVATLPGHSSIVTSLDISPDEKHVVTCSADRTVRIWDIGQRETVHKFSDHADQVWDVAYNYNGSRLVSVSEDKSLIIYTVPT